jgi:hypothetical protein
MIPALIAIASGLCGAVLFSIGVHDAFTRWRWRRRIAKLFGMIPPARIYRIDRWLRGSPTRARLVGFAIGAPLGIAVAVFTAWLSRRP